MYYAKYCGHGSFIHVALHLTIQHPEGVRQICLLAHRLIILEILSFRWGWSKGTCLLTVSLMEKIGVGENGRWDKKKGENVIIKCLKNAYILVCINSVNLKGRGMMEMHILYPFITNKWNVRFRYV